MLHQNAGQRDRCLAIPDSDSRPRIGNISNSVSIPQTEERLCSILAGSTESGSIPSSLKDLRKFISFLAQHMFSSTLRNSKEKGALKLSRTYEAILGLKIYLSQSPSIFLVILITYFFQLLDSLSVLESRFKQLLITEKRECRNRGEIKKQKYRLREES